MKEPEREGTDRKKQPTPPPSYAFGDGSGSVPVGGSEKALLLPCAGTRGVGKTPPRGGKEVAHGRRGCSGLSDIPFIVWQINVRRPAARNAYLQTRFLFKRAERKKEVDLRLGALRKKIQIKKLRRLYWYTCTSTHHNFSYVVDKVLGG